MLDTTGLSGPLRSGDRKSLSKAITLVESTLRDDRVLIAGLMDSLVLKGSRQALRIGLTGPPGAGKSTFVDAFGTWLTERGKKLAVLAVDPSSSRTGGSILGDKTRMERLLQDSNAFVRPSPTGTASGGVSRRTREAVYLCEQAGFDIVLVETAGVGQSETNVSEMSDIFVLMLPPAAGDELQGVKRGIMEFADLVLVSKADGDLENAARQTCAQFASALQLFARRKQIPPGYPKAFMISSREKIGLNEFWKEIGKLETWRKDNGTWLDTRRRQETKWLQAEIQESLLEELLDRQEVRQTLIEAEQRVLSGQVSPTSAATTALRSIRFGWRQAKEC
ncbi:MAG: methylmalonyl Co-A mutase-associated GTPase MeaB [Albidovulum sp.]|nr:methylmalonyl Co-A mutase-associated GTPase MeaB [Albidovulum sp.]MDE0304583.1 methylmalonyl Co-A mutase-associated GTPase MeaB [Albidovulum sp.]MDE0531491.1 methylmalonyl Co-A mutase-associated GTPase MeaB [Albidovulum sp.]